MYSSKSVNLVVHSINLFNTLSDIPKLELTENLNVGLSILSKNFQKLGLIVGSPPVIRNSSKSSLSPLSYHLMNASEYGVGFLIILESKLNGWLYVPPCEVFKSYPPLRNISAFHVVLNSLLQYVH